MTRATTTPTPEPEAEALIERLEKTAKDVTPGPWIYEPHVAGVSWLVGPKYVERGIGPRGTDLEGIAVTAIAKDTEANAVYFALCSPDNITALISFIRSQAARIAELEERVHYAEGTADANIQRANDVEAQRDRLASRVERLRGALEGLANCSDGLSFREAEMREIIGNTNWSVLRHWIDESRIALKETQDAPR